jgi:hypothetical protein
LDCASPLALFGEQPLPDSLTGTQVNLPFAFSLGQNRLSGIKKEKLT